MFGNPAPPGSLLIDRYRGLLLGLNPLQQLAEMPALMLEVILNQEPEGHRCVISHHALDAQSLFRNPINDRGQNLVLDLPPAQQSPPILLGIPMRGDPRILRVFWAAIAPILCRTHKPLPIVGRRIEQMPENLLARPSTATPGRIRQPRVQPQEPCLKHAEFPPELLCNPVAQRNLRHTLSYFTALETTTTLTLSSKGWGQAWHRRRSGRFAPSGRSLSS